ncbi:Cyanoglobin; Hemoglobin-like protein HbN [[Actinomadura] parvosata subsp. kistnae]|uniref:Group 1 truncated hemoglobin n=1 Tax=[Actinomadura] parvosata subsp. kistnae TaxID=1909395 RepID=A0A1V0A5N2_9ACTN|nr:group 1 truncated hemoglobin [Nonomuraea sp. ATCC 55076]AQZ65518.1 group 1 truncated hemoglobin [Nonomuraea sp. ATCC 55076]SPL96875.1 Cyanoglobin; Hemoglobin-like protein HbN [Actinomadura parvosata subsp. kistnae]
MTSIFDQVGGASAVSAVVDEFYTRVLADPSLQGYFTGTDVGRLKAHQRSFVAAALGGPQQYRGKSMAEAHAGMGITGADFDAVVGHLAGSLAHCGVPGETIATIAGALAPLKDQIVSAQVRA